jgi:hypothetical protein
LPKEKTKQRKSVVNCRPTRSLWILGPEVLRTNGVQRDKMKLAHLDAAVHEIPLHAPALIMHMAVRRDDANARCAGRRRFIARQTTQSCCPGSPLTSSSPIRRSWLLLPLLTLPLHPSACIADPSHHAILLLLLLLLPPIPLSFLLISLAGSEIPFFLPPLSTQPRSAKNCSSSR